MTSVNSVSGFNPYPENNRAKKKENQEQQPELKKGVEQQAGDELNLSMSQPENSEPKPDGLLPPWLVEFLWNGFGGLTFNEKKEKYLV